MPHPGRPWFATLLLLGVWLVPLVAGADAIGPPPEHCPNGSSPSSSHVGEYCYPSQCIFDGDCDKGFACVERALCIEPMQGYSRSGPMTVDHAVTSCDGDGLCPPGASCATARRCVPRGATLGGDGPRAMTLGIVAAAAVVLLLVAVLVVGLVALVALRSRKKRAGRRD